MAQHAILNHPDVALDTPEAKTSEADWPPQLKLFYFLVCAIGSWAIVLAPFFLFA